MSISIQHAVNNYTGWETSGSLVLFQGSQLHQLWIVDLVYNTRQRFPHFGWALSSIRWLLGIKYWRYLNAIIESLVTSLYLFFFNREKGIFFTMNCFSKNNLISEVLYTLINYVDLKLDVGLFYRPTQYSSQDVNRCSVGWRQCTWPDPHHPSLLLSPLASANSTLASLLRTQLGCETMRTPTSLESASSCRNWETGHPKVMGHTWGRSVSMLTKRVRGETKTKGKVGLNEEKEEEEGKRTRGENPIRPFLSFSCYC